MKKTLRKSLTTVIVTFCMLFLLSIPVQASAFKVVSGKEITLSFSSSPNQSVQWNVSDSSKLSLISTGTSSVSIGSYSRTSYSATFRGGSVGNVTVSAVNGDTGNVLSTATVTVIADIGFKLKYDTVFVPYGESFRLEPINVPSGESLTWTTDNPYATVSSSGLVSVSFPWHVTTVTCSTSDGVYRATCTVIGETPSYTANRSMTVGDTDTLAYSLRTSLSDISLTEKWTSINPNIVRVDSKGNITANAQGVAKILCEIGNCTLTYNITVSPVATPTPTATPVPTATPIPTRISISNASVGNIKTQVYNKKLKKPALVVAYNGNTLKNSVDYTVQYSANKKPGIAKCTITGIGKYVGTKEVYFNISPKKQTIKSLQSKKTKSAVLKYKKVTGQSGVQICYSTSKSFKNAKYTTTSGTSKTISKLKSKKTYYFKIRAYKTVNGNKIYGPYSSVKKVKIK